MSEVIELPKNTPDRKKQRKFIMFPAFCFLVLLVPVFMAGCKKDESAAAPQSAAPKDTASLMSKAVLATALAKQDMDAKPVNLGTAGNFAILTETGISTTGVTAITGNIGVSPISSTAITGFSLVKDASNQFSKSIRVTGEVFAPNYAAPTPSNMTTAVSDMRTAFTLANGRVYPAPVVEDFAGDISGRSLPPGLYKWSTGVLVTSVGVTLTGLADDVWVFQIAKNLTIDNSAMIRVRGGAQAKNVFWIVSGKATLGTAVNFKGNILSKTLISLNSGTTVDGRLLAQTAVTLISDTVRPQ